MSAAKRQPQDDLRPASSHSPTTPDGIMNFFRRRNKKKKTGKKTKLVKKKLQTGVELIMAGGLWTAGGNIVDAITEDSSATQIQAQEVNYIEDKTRALLEFKTNQHDSINQSNWWYIIGYILLGLGGLFMAYPALRLLRWVRRSCGSSSLIEEDDSKTAAVKYHPDKVCDIDLGQSSKDSVSMDLPITDLGEETSMKYPTTGYP